MADGGRLFREGGCDEGGGGWVERKGQGWRGGGGELRSGALVSTVCDDRRVMPGDGGCTCRLMGRQEEADDSSETAITDGRNGQVGGRSGSVRKVSADRQTNRRGDSSLEACDWSVQDLDRRAYKET